MTIFYELQFKIAYYDDCKTHIFKTSNRKDILEARKKVIEYFINMVSVKIIEYSQIPPCQYQKDMMNMLLDDLSFLKDATNQFINQGSYIYGERRFIFTKKDVTEIT